MDTFDVLNAVSKRKNTLIHEGISEKEALNKAEQAISREYHISLPDVKKLVG